MLTLDNYSDTVLQVWENAKKVRNAQATFTLLLFIYIERSTDTLAIRRATQQNIASSSIRLPEFIREDDVDLEPLQLQYASVVAARLPISAPIEIPSNATMQQLRHVDRMAENHADERRRDINIESEPYRMVRIRIGSVTSAPVECYISVEDMRRSLGLPQCDLTPAFRAPMHGLSEPLLNTEDVDHIEE
ncbi:hypothetical protein H257_10550 [Aphanomyces astaci]|uniref:Uncharacterized protein n=1 Tax=Aphanomyces astaci TaxID=112090 RepID=W4G5D4_APHAT|nr:hypothetical protein H257_10550 [Aphanomyces astaci]ETV74927.1 hypothetical protein H257_10550 [Aphanomyces astaci]|eukprot:XP_009835431.1 hypothetical protein H257_10550 [Aphanomyces astaci]